MAGAVAESLVVTAAELNAGSTCNVFRIGAVCGREQLAGRTDIDVAVAVEVELGPREGVILTAAPIPDRDVRRNTAFDQPAEELAGAIGRIGDEASIRPGLQNRNRTFCF
jgi:hypothetical protein